MMSQDWGMSVQYHLHTVTVLALPRHIIKAYGTNVSGNFFSAIRDCL